MRKFFYVLHKKMAEESASIIPILKQIPFFENLNDQDNEEIIKNIKYQLYPANYTIFSEGEMGDTMYIIRKGQVQVSQQQKAIATLNPNDFFGEMALFSDQPRNATIITTQETEVFTLNKRDLFALISEDENMASRVNNEFLERVKQNDDRANQAQNAAPAAPPAPTPPQVQSPPQPPTPPTPPVTPPVPPQPPLNQ